MISPKLPVIFFGGDYNPDQWPEEIWREDIRLFKKAGVNLVTLPVFSWTKLEPEEGVFEFGWLDRIMDLLAENNIYVCLATSTAAQPTWMSLKYPDIMPVDIAGRRRTPGKRVNFCPNSTDYRRLSAEMARQLALRYGHHPALLIWHIANEYGTYCYCDHCAEEFRKWAQARYKTIDEVNRRWNLSFWNHTIRNWDEIILPTELNDDDKYYQEVALDYLRFMTDSNIGCYLTEYNAIKAITPDIPVTTNISGLIKHLDQFKFAKCLDIIGWDNYPTPGDDLCIPALKHDLMRSLKDKPYMMVEQSPNQQNWQPYNLLKRPGEVRLLSYQALAHGAESVLFFQMRQSVGGVEKFHGAMISHAGHENTRVFRECSTLGEELHKLGDQFLSAKYPARVALMFDWDNWWALELSCGPNRDLRYFDQITAWYKALYDRNISVNLVQPDAPLSGYDLVLAPVLYMLKPGVAQSIADYTRNGGTFVTTFMSGIVDENDLVPLGGYPGALREALGIWVEEIDALPPDRHNAVVIDMPQGRFTGRYDCGMICDVIHTEGARALGHFESDFYAGSPCLTVNSYGKGRAYYVGTSAEQSFLHDFIKSICDDIGIHPPFEAPEGVEVTQRVKDGILFSFLINHTSTPAQIWLGETDATELLSGNKINGSITVKPNDVAIIKAINHLK